MATKSNKPAKGKPQMKVEPKDRVELKITNMLLLGKCSDGNVRQIIFPEKSQRAVLALMEAISPINTMQVHENIVDVNWENDFNLSK